MMVSNKTLWMALGILIAGITLHQICIRRDSSRMEPVRPWEAPPEVPVAIRPEAVREDPPARTVRPDEGEGMRMAEGESSIVRVDPDDSPAVRRRLLEEQVWQMEKYAREAGPDDPFALSPGEIEDFRQRGDPYLW